MDIQVPDNWLKTYLKTTATSKQIADCLSLCGPSVEKITKVGNDKVYSIEVTTNRVDSASIYGIAREASAILPKFNIKAKLLKIEPIDTKRLKKSVGYLKAHVDQNLCYRFTAVLIKNTSVKKSPKWLEENLKLVGVRPINNVVDVSNYVMHELGQPVHTFDYDKIIKKKMVLRESKKGETITTLDGKKHKLPGGDIVIEDGESRLIDLAGIMGGENSSVSEKTKNVLLFIQTYNPINIRRTSMSLAHRTTAAELFEKGLDTELVSLATNRALELIQKLKIGKGVNDILDLYPKPFKEHEVIVTYDFIHKHLGIDVPNKEILDSLKSLGFAVKSNKDSIIVGIPSHRSKDISIPEDIVEEIARIYGYHNLPSELMKGIIPDPIDNSPFEFEKLIKLTLSGWGGVEVYTQSLVPLSFISGAAYKLKNPLGKDGEYLRNSLENSLINAAESNKHVKDSFLLFEISNIYSYRKNHLPIEKALLAGISTNSNYRENKGIVEALLEKFSVKSEFIQEEMSNYLPSKHLLIKSGNVTIGHMGILSQGHFYFEFDIEKLRTVAKSVATFHAIPKYPPQIEDMTIKLPEKTKVGDVLNCILNVNNVTKAILTTIYNDSYTFRIWYQNPNKTLDNKEVEVIRKQVIKSIEFKFGGVVEN